MGEVVLPRVYFGHRAASVRILRGVGEVHDAEMSAATVQAGTRLPRGVPRALLVLVALSAAFAIGTMVWASGYGQGRPINYEALFAVVFAAWELLPFAAMGAVVILAARRMRGAMAIVALGVLVLGILTVAFLLDFLASESSTAALIFVVLPVYQLLVVMVTAAAAFGLHALLRRRRLHRPSPGGLAEGGAL